MAGLGFKRHSATMYPTSLPFSNIFFFPKAHLRCTNWSTAKTERAGLQRLAGWEGTLFFFLWGKNKIKSLFPFFLSRRRKPRYGQIKLTLSFMRRLFSVFLLPSLCHSSFVEEGSFWRGVQPFLIHTILCKVIDKLSNSGPEALPEPLGEAPLIIFLFRTDGKGPYCTYHAYSTITVHGVLSLPLPNLASCCIFLFLRHVFFWLFFGFSSSLLGNLWTWLAHKA